MNKLGYIDTGQLQRSCLCLLLRKMSILGVVLLHNFVQFLRPNIIKVLNFLHQCVQQFHVGLDCLVPRPCQDG